MGIGVRLEAIMKAKGINANELAKKIGVTPSTIYSMIKRDSNRVDIDLIIKIAHALGIPDAYIMEMGGWRTDRTMKRVYRSTLADRAKTERDKLTAHFDEQYHVS